MQKLGPQEWKEVFAPLDDALELPAAARDEWLETSMQALRVSSPR